ncbi:uncharacterized protein [Centruroides vittatus]|uniref:uncharacterized protein n=1 Tax=Centruroides vittatus TaxID=120091 RepID=UPI00350ECBC4
MAEDESVDKEVTGRIQAGWRNWREMSGVLCDKRMPLRLKGKVYWIVVRPAMLYAIETVSLRKTHVKRMEVAEMRMLRWMCGVTRRDHIRKEYVRGTVKVANIEAKIQEARLKWFGHVVRREEEYVGRRVMQMTVRGRRRRRTAAETVDGSCGGGLERKASECGGSPRQGAVETTHQNQ